MEKQNLMALKASLGDKEYTLNHYKSMAKIRAPKNQNTHRDTVSKLEGKVSAIKAQIENYGRASLFQVRFKTTTGWFETYLSGIQEAEIPQVIQDILGSYEVKLQLIETEPFIISTISTKELFQI